MGFNNEEFELSTDIETEMLLTEVPMEVIKANIQNQLANPMNVTVDYLSTVTHKFDAIAQLYKDNPDALSNLTSASNDFYTFLIDEISDQFDLGVEYDDANAGELRNIGTILYDFLVLRYTQNVTAFFYQSIVSDKSSLALAFKKYHKKKDVSTTALKRKLRDKEILLLIANLPEVFSHILGLDTSGQDFLGMIGTDEFFEAQHIENMILAGNLSDDFVSCYLKPVEYGNIGETYLDDILIEVRRLLIDKYQVK